MKKQRSGSIDLLKFLLAMAITIFHARTIVRVEYPMFAHGYFATDIFFVISGFFLAKAAWNKPMDSFTFMKKKVQSFWIMHTIIFLVAFVAMVYLRELLSKGIYSIIKLAIASLPEYLLIPPMAGTFYKMGNINGVEWYLSAMLIGMAILYPCLKKWGKEFCGIICPLIFIFTAGLLYAYNGKTYNALWTGDYPLLAILRGIADMSGGVFVHYLLTCSDGLQKDAPMSISKKVFLTAAEALCYLILFYYMYSNADSYFEFSVIYIAMFGLLLTFSGKTYSAMISGKVFEYLGALSLAIFLNQSWIRKVFVELKLTGGYKESVLAFTGTVLVVAVLTMCIEQAFKKLFLRRRENNAVQI